MLRDLAISAFHTTGGLDVVRWMKRKRVRILMYHRFNTSASVVASQLAHIRKTYALVSLTQLADWLTSGGPMPDNACVVTVDDGYGDFFSVAYPLFSEYGIPATVYLVSDFYDGKLWMWSDRVRYTFRQTTLAATSLELPDGTTLQFEFDTPAKRLKGALALEEALKLLPHVDLLAVLDCLPKRLKVDLPATPPPEFAPLSRDQVRAVSPLIEFGAHSATHPILSKVSCPDELKSEIEGSKRRIEKELDRPVVHFGYPNGRHQDISAAVVEAVCAAGFRTAVTSEPGLIDSTDDPLYLPRIGVAPEMDERYFQRRMAGFRIMRRGSLSEDNTQE
jgi:peptidoglycan/xylan/chitin deacetylase (PgdA/CDA1 family)